MEIPNIVGCVARYRKVLGPMKLEFQVVLMIIVFPDTIWEGKKRI